MYDSSVNYGMSINSPMADMMFACAAEKPIRSRIVPTFFFDTVLCRNDL